MTLQAFDVRGEAWHTVTPGLKEIQRLTNPDWRIEDLYAACVAQRMFLFKPCLATFDFVLLARNVSGYSGKAYLLVVAAYSKDGDAITKFQSEIEDIARQSGCEAIEFCSPRKGWERLAVRHGFAEVTRVYRRKL